MKSDYDRATTSTEQDNHHRRNWEESPWEYGTTNDDGIVDLTIEEIMLDRNSGANPSNDRDLTNTEQILSIGDGSPEKIHLLLNVNAVGQGTYYSATVEKITKPKYVDTQN